MFKINALLTVLIIATVPNCSTAQESDFKIESGFESLFNGKDLSGWNVLPTTEAQKKQHARWKKNNASAPPWPIFKEKIDLDGKMKTPDGRYVAQDGMLVVTEPAEGRRIQQLYTKREFGKDFVLKLEFRAATNADSGVFIRGKQLQCRDYPNAGPYKELKKFKANDWNEMVVVVKGTTAHCTCNGEVLEDKFDVPENGPIGLEGDQGKLEYRRIRIGSVDENADANNDDEQASHSAPGKQVEMGFKTSDGATVDFLLYLPKNYDSKGPETYPLIYFLHGRGESYGPLDLVAKWGPPMMAARGDDLPYIIVSPQCPGKDSWSSDTQQKRLDELLEDVIANSAVDTKRMYLTGLSMGGYGSWKMAANHPKRFAAVAPVCGGGDPKNAEKLVDIPMWVFHGDRDGAVPFQKSVDMVDAIKKAGGEKIRFTTFEHIGHNCWSATYATPELYQWMNKQKLLAKE